MVGQHQHDQRVLRGAEQGGGGAQVPGPQEEEDGEGEGEPRQWDQLPVHLALHDGRSLPGQRDGRPAPALDIKS